MSAYVCIKKKLRIDDNIIEYSFTYTQIYYLLFSQNKITIIFKILLHLHLQFIIILVYTYFICV